MSWTQWDKDYFALATFWANRKSKDPRTKVGCVIVNPELNRVISLGYNGFPKGVEDKEARYAEKETKYQLVVHAEANAILTARTDVTGCTLYTTLYPCNECTKLIIQAGITKVICPRQEDKRQNDSHWWAVTMLREAGIEVITV